MDQKPAKQTSLPANIRVMIALVASPTLLVVGMLIYTIWTEGWKEVSISMIVFTILSAFAYFIVITGNLPSFRKS
ncbi:hypothetical protein [Paraglaciecola sp. 2405UD69-4]|uniref:hypothetical protein n=1 Tax=Paraglaciecola sp. 2405UD69-4 TaxID=3391836 RepID=UPI0039C97494